MKKLSGYLVLTLLCAGSSSGCSSFSWFGSGGPLYAMNFDWYPESEISFSVNTGENGARILAMYFRDGNSDPVPAAGMNSLGLFASMQVIDNSTGAGEPSPDKAMIWDPFFFGLWGARDYSEVEEMVKQVPLVQYMDIPLHLHFASPGGEAMVVEAGEEENRVLTRGENGFLVVTNFSNTLYSGVSPSEITGCGADRYRIIHECLSEYDSISENMCFFVLQEALNESEGFPTRASMVFNPETGRVHIALDGNMNRIWTISLESGMVSGFRGLPEDLSYVLPESGVTADDLTLRVEGY